MGGGEGGANLRGGAYFKFRPIGGAVIRRGHLFKGGGALIRRFTVFSFQTEAIVHVFCIILEGFIQIGENYVRD